MVYAKSVGKLELFVKNRGKFRQDKLHNYTVVKH